MNTDEVPFWEWSGCCEVCDSLCRFPTGLFCHNFGKSRLGFRKCKSVWCGACYRQQDEVEFHIAEPMNDEGVVWKRKEDKDRFLT